MACYGAWMKLEGHRIQTEMGIKNRELDSRKEELTVVQQHEEYMKLLAAKYLEENTRPVRREESLKYLTNLLEELKGYNTLQKNVHLTNFQISSTKITLQGTVSSLKDIYAEWGILDKFSAYPFIKFFRVPYYRKTDNGYEFLLDADIKHYDGTDPAS